MLKRTLCTLLFSANKTRGLLFERSQAANSPLSSILNNNKERRMTHTKARCALYPYRRDEKSFVDVTRYPVSDDKVSWGVEWAGYAPVEFTAPFVLTAPWADPELDSHDFKPAWNSLDGKVNRNGGLKYSVDGGRPLNPSGRTGIKGRGVLGRWGPNHAADPIVTRWKRTSEGTVETSQGKQVLEFVSIERKDGGGWAIPGGMVDPGEKVSVTLKREFMEEAMDSTAADAAENVANAAMIEEFFKGGVEIYSGYVDDPRNTDNAWMETVAVMFHDEVGDKVANFKLKAGDDAKSLKWQEINGQITLYASHKDFIKKVADRLGACW